ncbi:hypothetical protein I4I78_02930 [Pseudonocardia sp. KRD-291]|nr:hypothetical protein [Pseudonocardia sp. KRD291]
MPSLLSADDLAALKDDVVVLDASTHLSTTSDGVPYTVHPHRDEFLAEHLPGARFAAWATRVWWLLRVFGHDRVSVLDGGLQAWREAGLTVETGDSVDRTTGRFLDRDALADNLRGSGLTDTERAVTYCGGGIAATLPAFAAYLVTGTEVAVYDGSLSEWTADADLPVVVG